MELPAPDRALPRHPMKVVVRRTGLKPDLIRAWERRYGAVRPSRTPTGRRLYSDEQVTRLRLLRLAVDGGRRIGDVGTLPLERLRLLVRDDCTSQPAAAARGLPTGPRPEVVELIETLRAGDPVGLDAALRLAELRSNPLDYVCDLALPLLRRVGTHVAEGSLRIWHEHLATAVVRCRMACMLAELAGRQSGPGIVLSAPRGQMHELGALAAAVVAATEGWTVTWLGVNLPAEEILAAALDVDARAVALSLVHPAADRDTAAELTRLRASLAAGVPLYVGGSAAETYSSPGASGILILPDLRRFARRLASERHVP